MGSAEYEFGALNKSLARIRANLKDYIYTNDNFAKKFITIFGPKDDIENIKNYINSLSQQKCHLKEYCDFPDWISGNMNTNDHWWDIDNDWMFWKQVPEFTDEFRRLIQPTRKD